MKDSLWSADIFVVNPSRCERIGCWWSWTNSHDASQQATLNPVFDGNGDVGGADADLIVNRCLINATR